MATITYKDENGEYTISVNKEEMSLHEVVMLFIKPVMRAAGYCEHTVTECFGEDDI